MTQISTPKHPMSSSIQFPPVCGVHSIRIVADSIRRSIGRGKLMWRGRLVFLLGMLFSLAVCYPVMFAASAYQWPSTREPTLWLTPARFYQYIDGQHIALARVWQISLARLMPVSQDGQGPVPQ